MRLLETTASTPSGPSPPQSTETNPTPALWHRSHQSTVTLPVPWGPFGTAMGHRHLAYGSASWNPSLKCIQKMTECNHKDVAVMQLGCSRTPATALLFQWHYLYTGAGDQLENSIQQWYMLCYRDKWPIPSKMSPPLNLRLLPVSQESPCCWLLSLLPKAAPGWKTVLFRISPWQTPLTWGLEQNSAEEWGGIWWQLSSPLCVMRPRSYDQSFDKATSQKDL